MVLTAKYCIVFTKLIVFFLSFLTHFWPMFPFYTSWKHQKTKSYLVFSGVYIGNFGQKWVNKDFLTRILMNHRSEGIWRRLSLLFITTSTHWQIFSHLICMVYLWCWTCRAFNYHTHSMRFINLWKLSTSPNVNF